MPLGPVGVTIAKHPKHRMLESVGDRGKLDSPGLVLEEHWVLHASPVRCGFQEEWGI